MRTRRLGKVWTAVVGPVLAVLLPGGLSAQENGGGVEPLLLGFDRLLPLEGSPSPDASGALHLRERGDRSAIHVIVRGLVPGATYDVVFARGDTVETAGTITTHPGEAPPPRCFRARLSLPEPAEEPAEEPGGEEVAENGGNDGGEPAVEGEGGGGHFSFPWRRHRRHREVRPSGSALFLLDREETTLRWFLSLRGLGDREAAVNLLAGEAALELDPAERSGSLEVGEDVVAALRAGEGRVAVTEGESVLLEGEVVPCLSESFRERLAERRAGRGALRIDTARGDTLPLGAESLAELEGAEVRVVDADGAVALQGEVGPLAEFTPRRHRHRGDRDGANGGDGDREGGDDAGAPAEGGEGDAAAGEGGGGEAASFFALPEVHDARFVRGDANDDGRVELTDAVYVLLHLFRSGPEPYCKDAADVNDDGRLDVTDPVALLQALFQGRDAGPVGLRRTDTTADELFCRPVEE